ncbi:thiamine diphosphate-binding protein [Peziza echinospora]|nr:thiamine diphosphate-binding protein [Peziza echinospora]
MSDQITVGAYLFKRLHEFGVRGVHGVPGDYNLVLLDLLPENGLYWVGNCNELNAGYAADGYARIKGLSALITTFGVGELSALAAIAGSYSEHVPVVHIVGVPHTASQQKQLMLHHTLGNGDFGVFSDMSRSISDAYTTLDASVDCAKEIDRVLRTCWIRARPVYIAIPTDSVHKKIDGSRLKKKIPLELDPNPKEFQDEVVRQILKLMYDSKNTVIIADACSIRHRVLDELHELVEKTKLPTFVTPMGKGAVNETIPQFGGVYVGDVSRPDVKERVETAELILFVGGLISDFNSGGFTFHISRSKTVEFHSDHMKVRYAEFPNVEMKTVLQQLIKEVDMTKVRATGTVEITNVLPKRERDSISQDITHAWLWPSIGQWLKAKDVIITETGTANFGILETRFKEDVVGISQVLWGSIGYSVGALQGAALAVKEQKKERRVILFVGDGSLQLTVQEISTMLRHDLTPIIFVINNDGYTIERKIHGPNASYNDIQPWRHTKLFDVFGADNSKTNTYQIKTRTELQRLLANKEFSDAKKIQMVELFMPKQDAPRALEVTAQAAARLNAQLSNRG